VSGVGSRLCVRVCACIYMCVFISRGQGHATAQTVTSPSAQHTSDRNRWCRRWQRNSRGRRRRLWSTSSPVAPCRSAPTHTRTHTHTRAPPTQVPRGNACRHGLPRAPFFFLFPLFFFIFLFPLAVVYGPSSDRKSVRPLCKRFTFNAESAIVYILHQYP